MSCKDPDFSTTLIDRLIFSVCYAGIRPVLCITKLDLIAENDAIHEEIQHYIDNGYEVYQSGKGYASEDLIQALKGNISVLTGQSGAGKSSLLNRIDPTFHLQTQEISKALVEESIQHGIVSCMRLPAAGWQIPPVFPHWILLR